eukprot:TRINITY_DN7531_c0_g1_i1.p1 TRINITY_DN7531_c0_g1~~TRINITY_DN7531_c0_g1_i1.p1  ORF type:complete len:1986 (+),score=735.47 TRINITY_DN7531_c0_g1_i1:80-6037(+)
MQGAAAGRELPRPSIESVTTVATAAMRRDSAYGGTGVGSGTRDVFLDRGLKRIASLASGRKFAQLRTACTECAKLVPKIGAEGPDPASTAANAERLMSLCFIPLRMACESRQPPMIEVAVDCMQKLMAYSFITGDMKWSDPSGWLDPLPPWAAAARQWAEQLPQAAPQAPRPGATQQQLQQQQQAERQAAAERALLIHHIVVCLCANVSHHHDGVQLQVIKALISAVSTPSCGLHGQTLLMAVRNTYNIYLIAHSPINQTTAKGTLTQMISIVFNRMEATADSDRQGADIPALVVPPAPAAAPRIKNPLARAASATPPAGDTAVLLTPSDAGAPNADPVDVALPDSVAGSPTSASGTAQGNGADPVDPRELCRQLVLSVAAAAVGDPDPYPPIVDPQRAREHLHSAFHAAHEDSEPCETPRQTPSQTPSQTPRVAERQLSGAGERQQQMDDAFLIFRSLCKLSSKYIPGSETLGPDTLEMKSKLLSMELILGTLINAGQVFRNSERFIKVVRQDLCLSLLKNCVSPVLPVFRTSLHIFLALIARFKDHLKHEIGLFFTNVLLIILESSNSPFHQKMLVIQTIHKITETPQTIIDVFVNYDCALESVNIFEAMMNHLSRILQTRHADAVVTLRQEADMKLLALRTLVMVLRSLVQWTDRFMSASGETESPQRSERGALSRRSFSRQLPEELTSRSADRPSALPEAHVEGASAEDAAACEDEIERARRRKLDIERQVAHFNKGAKRGLQALWESGVLAKEPKAVAQWLLATPGLHKKEMGEYLSRTGDFERQVLNDFVELFDFAGLEIDEALRRFLSKFQICGEAQVIDRTVEKFAEVYTRQNPQHFPNADTAYVLSFSIIMLNTDASNESIKEKMKKDEFFKNNRGIDDGKDLPESLLSAIYDRVTSRPFALDDPAAKRRAAKAAAPARREARVLDNLADALVSDGKRRATNYAHEMHLAYTQTKELLGSRARGARDAQHLFHIADRMEHARPMFEAAWAAMLPAFSVLLEQSAEDDHEVVDLCLEGFDLAIHVSCVFFLDVERDAFVSALSKLTFLSNYREIEDKNLKGIRLLIVIAGREGNYLRSSWYAVLRCISQLERLQLLGSGAKPDFAFIDEQPSLGGGRRHGADERTSAREKLRQYEHLNSQLIVEAIDDTAVSRIYSSTVDLNGEAIVFFVKHLCEVSAEEIEHTVPPRMFSLQKLIEVADLNMGRIRVVWSKVWQDMAKHFVRVGCNPSLSVSMYGIDSLRQLAVKFLAKRELANYQFQRDFLKPFETILARTKSIEIRELIVRCLAQMVQSGAVHIKSGWKSIFAVLSHAASDPSDQIVALAFDTVDHIFERLLGAVVVADAFVDTVNCLIAFSCNRLSRSISIRAVQHMSSCADCLVRGVAAVPQGARAGADSGGESPVATEGEHFTRHVVREMKEGDLIDADDRTQLRVWFPILTGLCADATQHPDIEVRLAALSALFGVLARHGARFSVGMWRLVFAGSVYPVFDNAYCDLALFLSLPSRTAADDEAMRRNATMIEVGLAYLVDLFASYYPVLRTLIGEVLNIICNCIAKPAPPRVALIGIAALIDLLSNHIDIPGRDTESPAVPYPDGARKGEPPARGLQRPAPTPVMLFEEAEWSIVASRFWQLLDTLTPAHLLHSSGSDGQLLIPAGALPPLPSKAQSRWRRPSLDAGEHPGGAGGPDGTPRPAPAAAEARSTPPEPPLPPGVPPLAAPEPSPLSPGAQAPAPGARQLSVPVVLGQLRALPVALRTHHLLLRAVGGRLPLKVLTHFAACPDVAHRLAAAVLADSRRLAALHATAGGAVLHALLEAEALALRLHLIALCRLYNPYRGPFSESAPECRADPALSERIGTMLHALLADIFERFTTAAEVAGAATPPPGAAARVSALTPVCVDAVHCLVDLSDEELCRCLGQYYPCVLQISSAVLQRTIAQATTRFFARIGELRLGLSGLRVDPSPCVPELPAPSGARSGQHSP